MRKKLIELSNELRREGPGRRFYACYCHWRAREESRALRVFYVALGSFALLLGIVFALSPILPGFVFVAAGLVLLSARWAWMARALDRCELTARQWWQRYRRRRHGKSGRAGDGGE